MTAAGDSGRVATWIRPAVGPMHACVLAAIAARPSLQRRVVARTAGVSAGTKLRISGEEVTLGTALGSGMIAVTYAATRATGERLAVKRGRADLRLLATVLAAEAEAARELPRLAGIAVAEVLASDGIHLVKRRYDGSTLQRVLAERRALTAAQQTGLEDLLGRAAKLRASTGYHVDPSPKNLTWEREQWVLLDAGQPLVAKPELVSVLETPRWETYHSVFGRSVRFAVSEPSVMTRAPDEGPVVWDGRAPLAYLPAWSLWVPLEVTASASTLLVTVDDSVIEDEVLFLMDPPRATGAPFQMRRAPDADADLASAPAAVAAIEEFRATYVATANVVGP